ncbi:MAG: HEPN domain-containing protein [Planctomycetaceae bacterium]
MTSDEFLQLARELSAGPSEAYWRTAVSRAYYASFHLVRQRLSEWGFHIRKSDQAHAGMSRRLGVLALDGWDDLARDLSQLRTDRNFADYDIERVFPKRLAVNCLAVTERIIKTLHTKLSDNEQQQAIAAIRDYERNVLRDVTWRQS